MNKFLNHFYLFNEFTVNNISWFKSDRSGRLWMMLALCGSHLATSTGHLSVKERARAVAATTAATHDLEKVARRSSLAESLDLLEGSRRETITYDRGHSMRILLGVLHANRSDSSSHTSDDRIHTRFSATDIRVSSIIRHVGSDGHITRAKDSIEILEGEDVIDLLLAEALSHLGNARTNEYSLTARITLLADVTDVVHGRSSVRDSRLDLGNVLVDHVDPGRAAGGGHERQSTFLLLLKVLHTLIEFSGFSESGHISTDGNLDTYIEAGLHDGLLEARNADWMREVTSNSRGKHGNHLTLGIHDTTDNISDLGTRLNSTEWAVDNTLTTADALVKVEDLTVVRKSLNGTNRAVGDTGCDLVDDSTERTSLGAVATLDTLARIDASLASGVVDGLLGTGLSTRTRNTVLTHVGHDVLLLGTMVANVLHESENRKSKIGRFAFQSLLGKFRKRLSIILFTLQTKSSNDTAANLATLSNILLRNNHLRKIINLFNKFVSKDKTTDTFHDVIFNLYNTIRN